jgi:crossover junction endodeoxyribonuclease RusA
MHGRIRFRVFGIPRPQGSKRAVARHVMVESAGEGLKTWRGQVAVAAREARPGAGPLDCPVELGVTFYLPPPRKPRWPWPAKVPDLSKLIRGLEDELSGVVVVDDRLIVRIRAEKQWASEAAPPGASVWIGAVE